MHEEWKGKEASEPEAQQSKGKMENEEVGQLGRYQLSTACGPQERKPNFQQAQALCDPPPQLTPKPTAWDFYYYASPTHTPPTALGPAVHQRLLGPLPAGPLGFPSLLPEAHSGYTHGSGLHIPQAFIQKTPSHLLNCILLPLIFLQNAHHHLTYISLFSLNCCLSRFHILPRRHGQPRR